MGTPCPVERTVKGTVPLHRDLRAVSHRFSPRSLPLHLATEPWGRALIRVSIATEMLIPYCGMGGLMHGLQLGWSPCSWVWTSSSLSTYGFLGSQTVGMHWVTAASAGVAFHLPSREINKQTKKSRSRNISQNPSRPQYSLQGRSMPAHSCRGQSQALPTPEKAPPASERN